MDICALFNDGVSFNDFVNKDHDTYKEKTLEIYNSIEFNEALINEIKGVNKKIKILICAELWCPDCMINVPVVEKLREYNSNISLSIVGKEGNEELFRKSSPSESVRIPTFIVYDEDYNELGSFVEYPKKIKEIIDKGNQPNIIVAKRKYRKGEYAQETLRDLLGIIVK